MSFHSLRQQFIDGLNEYVKNTDEYADDLVNGSFDFALTLIRGACLVVEGVEDRARSEEFLGLLIDEMKDPGFLTPNPKSKPSD